MNKCATFKTPPGQINNRTCVTPLTNVCAGCVCIMCGVALADSNGDERVFQSIQYFGAPFLIIILSFLNSIRFVCACDSDSSFLFSACWPSSYHTHAHMYTVLIKKREQCGKIKLGIEERKEKKKEEKTRFKIRVLMRRRIQWTKLKRMKFIGFGHNINRV